MGNGEYLAVSTVNLIDFEGDIPVSDRPAILSLCESVCEQLKSSPREVEAAGVEPKREVRRSCVMRA
jgi:hypothetical protein